MKLIAVFLLAGVLSAGSLFIDCGSESDQYFSTGSAAYKNTGVFIGDATLRISNCSPNCPVGASFSYKIPAADDVPYVLKLSFLEPSVSGVLRRFNVVINEAPFATWVISPQGNMFPFSRSSIVFAVDGFITIRFDSMVRSAIVSSIEVAPLFQLFGSQ